MSNALKRLREQFDDPLFVRTPGGMVPAAGAKKLIDAIEEGLAKLNQAIDQTRNFVPGSSNALVVPATTHCRPHCLTSTF